MDLSKSLNYSLSHCNLTMTYSQNELDRIESQATADYIDVMADLAYEMCQSLREEYEADYYEDATI